MTTTADRRRAAAVTAAIEAHTAAVAARPEADDPADGPEADDRAYAAYEAFAAVLYEHGHKIVKLEPHDLRPPARSLADSPPAGQWRSRRDPEQTEHP